MGPIQVVVTDANNLVLEVTPTPNTTVILDRGIAGPPGPMGDGDVDGPASSTDNAVARFDGTTGKLIQNSLMTIADDGATVIAANSTTNALRITQTGSGNALLVEDSANPDSTPFSVDSNGFVLAGSTNGYAISGVSVPRIMSVATDQSAALGASNWGTNTAAGAAIQLTKSISGTIGTRGAVTNGTTLGMFRAAGDDGTAFIEAAQIAAQVDGTPGTNDMPGRLVFSTTADGASSPTERMRITNAGNVGIGTSSPAYKLDIGGSGDSIMRLLAAGQANGLEIGQLTADGSSKIFAANNNFLALGTNNTERARITAAGNVGIGTSSPTQRLTVTGNAAISGTITEAGQPVVVQTDLGTAPNEIPLNQYLGEMAYMNAESVVIQPQASAVPNGIGDMVFQLTNNTTLVIKVKGSDGTVRSATLTLA